MEQIIKIIFIFSLDFYELLNMNDINVFLKYNKSKFQISKSKNALLNKIDSFSKHKI